MRLRKLLLKPSVVLPVKHQFSLRRAVIIIALPIFVVLFTLPTASSHSQQPESTLSIAERQTLIRNAIARNYHSQSTYHINVLRQQGSWSTDLAQQIGDIYAEQGDMRSAIHYWSTSAQSNEELLARLADGYILLQQWQLARDTLHDLIERQPTNSWANFHLGTLEAIYGNEMSFDYLIAVSEESLYHDIATELSEIVARTTSSLIPMSIGTHLIQEGMWNLAEFAFLRASVLNNPYPEALAYQGWARYQQGKSGAEWIQQALILAPENTQILYLAGLEQRFLGDLNASLDLFLQAVNLAPDNPAFIVELANTYRSMGNFGEAEYWYLLATSITNNPEFEMLLIEFYEAEGANLNQTNLEALRLANQRYPDDPDIESSYGWALYVSGERDAGVETIEAVLSNHPNHPRSLYYLGAIALNEERTTDAQQYLLQVSTMNSPFALLANQLLARITNE